MNQLIFRKEMRTVNAYVRKCVGFYGKKGYNNIYVIADTNPIAEYLVPAVGAGFEAGSLTVVEAFEKTSVNRRYCEQRNLSINYISLEMFENTGEVENSVFILLCDTNLCDDRWFSILAKCEEKAKRSDSNKILVGAVLPKLRPIPNGIKYFAEREYSYYIECVLKERTVAEEFYIKLEKQCRKIVGDGFEKVNVLRFDNLIGAGNATTPNFDFEAMIKQAVEASKVQITKEDYCLNYSILGIDDAACAVVKAAFSVREGHIYNVVYYNTTIADMKMQIFEQYADRLSLSVHSAPCSEKEKLYYGLSHLKVQAHKLFPLKTMNSYQQTVRKAIRSFADLDF